MNITLNQFSYDFGMQMPGRNGSTGEYRYGFQGQEKDDEVKGEGNSINYKYRMHDPRIGRFFAVDPLASKYPHNSPYAFSENIVINAVELEGLERKYVNDETGEVKIISKVSFVTIGEYAIKNVEEMMETFEKVSEVYNAQGFIIKETTVNTKFEIFNIPSITPIEFEFELSNSNGDRRDAYAETKPGGEGEDLGVAIYMAKKGELSDKNPGAYGQNFVKLNPEYFDPSGKFYDNYTNEQRANLLINTLSHEVGHDFGLNHYGEDGEPSNDPSAYPDEGLMKAADPNRITPATNENLEEIEGNVELE